MVFNDEIEKDFAYKRINYPIILLSLTQESSKLSLCSHNYEQILLIFIQMKIIKKTLISKGKTSFFKSKQS